MIDVDTLPALGPEGVLITAAEPNTPAWYQARLDGVGSSEIAVVLGLSEWGSPFDLYWQKVTAEQSPPNLAMRMGTLMEPVIAGLYAGEHPEERVVPTGVCANRRRPWQRCSVDRLRYANDLQVDGTWAPTSRLLGPLECKTDGGSPEWGDAGTDEVPLPYKVQVWWQLDVLGLDEATVAVIFGGTRYVEYVIRAAEPSDLELMRGAALEFLGQVARREPPPLDGHKATRKRLQKLHPDVAADGDDDYEAPLPWSLVTARRHVDAQVKALEADRDELDNLVLGALGRSRIGTVFGPDGSPVKVCTRSVSDLPATVTERKAYTRTAVSWTRPRKPKALPAPSPATPKEH